MARYKYTQILTQGSLPAFDQFLGPGQTAPNAGIYRCEGCAREIGIAHGHTMPPQSHHQHTVAQGHIRWRLIVATAA